MLRMLRIVGVWFQGLFHLLVGVLFYLSRYWSTIGLTGVFSLAGWSRRIRAGFLVSRVTQDTAMPACNFAKGLSPPCGPTFPDSHALMLVQRRGPTTPDVPRHTRFGLFPGRSPLWRIRLIFSSCGCLRCFSSRARLMTLP